MKYFVTFTLAVACFIGAYWLGRISVKPIEPGLRIDTVRITDTLNVEIPVPQYHYITRRDTVRLRIPGDTITVPVEVPIVSKVYQTDEYRAEIQGFRAELVDMQLYRRTEYITRTEYIERPKKRFAVGVQAGYGFAGGKMSPYIGVGVSYKILEF